MREWVRWLVLHRLLRLGASIGARRGDPHARMIIDPTVRADPVPVIEELRSRGRLVKDHAVYLTVDYQIAHQILRSDDFRVAALGAELPRALRWLQERMRTGPWHPLEPPSLLSIEPPAHTRYRNLVRSAFTTRAAVALRARIEDDARELLDALDILADRSGTVDIVNDYCLRLPIAVIGDVLGVADEDRPQLLEFGQQGSPSLDFGQSWRDYRQVRHAIDTFDAWLADHLQRIRAEPSDDLLSELTRAVDEDERLTEVELHAIVGLILAAGFETTVNLLSNGIELLLEKRTQLETLASRPDLWRNAVEEILRLEPPVQMVTRVACADTDVDGTRVRQGEMVVIYLAGANRDPAVFDDPHRFDIERPNAHKHLSFSSGRHFCLGATLARAEGKIGLSAFFERYPHAQLAGRGTHRDTRVLRGWSSLPVTLGGSEIGFARRVQPSDALTR